MSVYVHAYQRFAKSFNVYDGDSFRADLDEGSYRWEIQRPFRIYGIDTPELRPLRSNYAHLEALLAARARDDEKEAAVEARDRVRAYLATAQGVVLIQTIKLPGKAVRDKYGRTLCRLLVPIGGELVDVAQRLLAEKHAKAYDGGSKGGAWGLLRPLGRVDPAL